MEQVADSHTDIYSSTMHRHIFLVPGFFGFANLGDFTYWGPVHRKLGELLDAAGLPATIHCVKSLPTASLRIRTRCLLETIAHTRPGPESVIHLVGHSTGGLDARLLLTPAVDLDTRIDVERLVARVASSVSVATPHRGAPIASFFTGMLGGKLLRLLSVMTMAVLRSGELPLSVWAEVAGLFAIPSSLGRTRGSLAGQLYEQLLADFTAERRTQVSGLLAEVGRDQSLLTQLTVESLDLFNAAAGNRDSVAYGSVVTRARPPSVESSLEIGFNAVDQAQQAFYYSLSRLAAGHEFPAPVGDYKKALQHALGEVPDSFANDGIVPTLSQPWGRCIAVAGADHLDIIGHYRDDEDSEKHYDWLTTHCNFRSGEFHDVWAGVVQFMAEAEAVTDA
ncbi:MAG: hypothetical protein OEV88_16905 [Gammaproteobacteria bacterium]|nr:hypothetical protein [Gammaproteobacteria bacterium]